MPQPCGYHYFAAIAALGSQDYRGVSEGAFAFNDNGALPDTITRAIGSFIADGIQIGSVIVITGTASNNRELTVVNVAAGTLTVASGSLVAEAAVATVLYAYDAPDSQAVWTFASKTIRLQHRAGADVVLYSVTPTGLQTGDHGRLQAGEILQFDRDFQVPKSRIWFRLEGGAGPDTVEVTVTG